MTNLVYDTCLFCHINIFIQNIIQVVYFISLYIIYDWIDIMIYSKHELSTINMLYSSKKFSSYYTPTFP